MADAFCEMKGDTEKDRGNVRYRVKSLGKGDREEGTMTELEWKKKREAEKE